MQELVFCNIVGGGLSIRVTRENDRLIAERRYGGPGSPRYFDEVAANDAGWIVKYPTKACDRLRTIVENEPRFAFQHVLGELI